MIAWIIKYWRPLSAAALVVALRYGLHSYGDSRYQAGKAAAETAYQAAVEKAQREQAQKALAAERRQAAALAAAQTQIEKERQDAKTAVDNLRGELGRLRQHTAARANSRANLPQTAATAGAPNGQEAARGWQILGQCAERYAAVAEVADSQRNDLAEWQAYGAVIASQPQ